MSYFWSTFIQPLYEDENPPKSQQPRPSLQKSQPTQIPKIRPEVDPNASIPTAKAFEPVYVTRRVKPQLTVVVPPPPPPSPSPSSVKDEKDEKAEICCTPDVKCNSSLSNTDVNSSMPSLVNSEDECTPTCTINRQFIYDGDINECSTPPLITFETECQLNKYNIQAQCTPQISAYNSPRLSVDKLYMFDWEPKYTTVNHGVFNNTMVNGGHYSTTSAPPSPTLKRSVRDTKTLEEMESELNYYVFELEQLRQKFEKLSFKLFDLQTDF